MQDYYAVLGVARGASPDEIRKAYMRMARDRHPDRFPDPVEKARADELFNELTAAYNTFSNERNRRDYDAQMERPQLTAPEEIAAAAFESGLQAFENADYQQAVDLFRTAAHHQPAEAKYLAALGRTLGKNPRWAREAIDTLEKAIQLEPGNGAFHA